MIAAILSVVLVVALGAIYGGILDERIATAHRWLERPPSRVAQPGDDWIWWSPAKRRWMERHYGFRPPPQRVPPKPKPAVSPAYRNHYGDLTVDMYFSR